MESHVVPPRDDERMPLCQECDRWRGEGLSQPADEKVDLILSLTPHDEARSKSEYQRTAPDPIQNVSHLSPSCPESRNVRLIFALGGEEPRYHACNDDDSEADYDTPAAGVEEEVSKGFCYWD